MIPLAVSGAPVVGVIVAAALALLWVLFKREDREEALEEQERRAEQEAERAP